MSVTYCITLYMYDRLLLGVTGRSATYMCHSIRVTLEFCVFVFIVSVIVVSEGWQGSGRNLETQDP